MYSLSVIDSNAGADTEAVFFRSLKGNLQVVAGLAFPAVVSVDESIVVHIIDDQVQVAVIIEICVGTTVGAGKGLAPGASPFGEGQVAIVLEEIVGRGSIQP